MNNQLILDKVTVHHQKTMAVSGISFSLSLGEIVCILGPSGSGKTTLMNIIGCLDSPTSGEYHLDDNEVSILNDNELASIRNKKISEIIEKRG